MGANQSSARQDFIDLPSRRPTPAERCYPCLPYKPTFLKSRVRARLQNEDLHDIAHLYNDLKKTCMARKVQYIYAHMERACVEQEEIYEEGFYNSGWSGYVRYRHHLPLPC